MWWYAVRLYVWPYKLRSEIVQTQQQLPVANLHVARGQRRDHSSYRKSISIVDKNSILFYHIPTKLISKGTTNWMRRILSPEIEKRYKLWAKRYKLELTRYNYRDSLEQDKQDPIQAVVWKGRTAQSVES